MRRLIHLSYLLIISFWLLPSVQAQQVTYRSADNRILEDRFLGLCIKDQGENWRCAMHPRLVLFEPIIVDGKTKELYLKTVDLGQLGSADYIRSLATANADFFKQQGIVLVAKGQILPNQGVINPVDKNGNPVGKLTLGEDGTGQFVDKKGNAYDFDGTQFIKSEVSRDKAATAKSESDTKTERGAKVTGNIERQLQAILTEQNKIVVVLDSEGSLWALPVSGIQGVDKKTITVKAGTSIALAQSKGSAEQEIAKVLAREIGSKEDSVNSNQKTIIAIVKATANEGAKIKNIRKIILFVEQK
jgi:hypothetical protein